MILHAIYCRMPSGMNRVIKFLATGGICGIFLAGFGFATRGARSEVFAGLLLYALMSELYIFLFTFVRSSISARLLLALSSKILAQAEVERLMDGRVLVHARVEDLAATGLLARCPSGYAVTKKGMMLVRVFRDLRTFFRRACDPAVATKDTAHAAEGCF